MESLLYLQSDGGPVASMGGLPHGLCRPRQGESYSGYTYLRAVLLETP
jgi:hypothetical protein